MKEVFIIQESTYNLWDGACDMGIKSIWATVEAAKKEIRRLSEQKPYTDIEVDYWIEKWEVKS